MDHMCYSPLSPFMEAKAAMVRHSHFSPLGSPNNLSLSLKFFKEKLNTLMTLHFCF